MAEDHAVEQGTDDLFFFRIEPGDGFELQLQLVVGAALVFGEEQQICTYAQSHGHPADDIERGLRVAALVTAELHHVHADPVGQSLLG